jgi:hypothetical protein
MLSVRTAFHLAMGLSALGTIPFLGDGHAALGLLACSAHLPAAAQTSHPAPFRTLGAEPPAGLRALVLAHLPQAVSTRVGGLLD